MKIYVVGSGKLASAILDSANPSFELIKWESQFKTSKDKSIVVRTATV